MTERPVLRRGAGGDAVVALHELLDAVAASAPRADAPDRFGAATEEAVRSFQRARGIQVDGICGRDTWAALEEARHPLGSRLLAQRRPMLRGDDVRALQQWLNRLGFDPGRDDGIFGPDTERALREFQRASGVAPDGVCGPATCRALEQVGGLAAGSILTVRESEQLAAAPHRLAGRRIVLCCIDRYAAAAGDIARGLTARGAAVEVVRDIADVAATANDADVDLALVVQPFDDPQCRVAFYGSEAYRSLRGSAIARRIAEALDECYGPAAGAVARTFGVLRETRMAAVVCQPAPHTVGTDLACLAAALVAGVQAGFEDPPSESFRLGDDSSGPS
jgi:N-acetylmuramoyl-L-alanine amidase